MALSELAIFRRKSLAAIHHDAESTGMRRTLGPLQLVLFGIGCIVGAGVYVVTGTAAAQFAGPAVVVSFLCAAVACIFVALCYAELAAALPVSGASYSYAYTVLGEVFAWGLGWMMMFEFSLGSAALAVGFSGYLSSFLADLGIHVPAVISTSWIQVSVAGGMHFAPAINLVAVAIVAVITTVLVRGISQSATVNTILVTVKIGVLLVFVLVGLAYIHPANWHPFIPVNEGGFHYGFPGVMRGASVLFFAYIGFESVATASSETRNPQHDVPRGILGALLVSTLLYVAVALVMTGLVSYKKLGVADPIDVAIAVVHMPVLSTVLKAGAVVGLTSVLLINTYAQSRVCHAMGRDGLLPDCIARLHQRFRTPANATIVVAIITAFGAALLPISILGDLVSLGTICVFLVVAIAVMWLRNTHPDMKRPFRMPGGGIRIRGVWIGVVPVIALISCLAMAAPVLIDIFGKAFHGEWIPAAILCGYIALGIAIYFGYGIRHAHLRNGEECAEALPAAEAQPGE